MANHQIHDTVFRDYFNCEERLLSLCNASLGTDYCDISQLKINTLQGTFFSNLKNDISCELDGRFLVLSEHQSTITPNMPYRMLNYGIQVLENYLAPHRQRFYGSRLVSFPSLMFFVFYDRRQEEPDTKTLRLSDASPGRRSMLELEVRCFNIRKGHRADIKSRCPYLEDYSTFIGRFDENRQNGMPQDKAIYEAIAYCIHHDIMKDYLEEKERQVFDMLNYEWNEDEARAVWREESMEEGLQRGLQQGRQEMADSFAINLLHKHLPLSTIAEYTNLSQEHIQKLGQRNGLL